MSLIRDRSDAIKSLGANFQNDPKIAEFENAIMVFEKLVTNGLAKKRGNNLLSSSNMVNKETVLFNLKTK